MTVQELIEELNKVGDKSQRVVVNGYEGGYSDADAIQLIELVLDVHPEWYYGRHDKPGEIPLNDEVGRDVVNAVLIRH